MTKSGSPGSDTHATGLPCAWPLHPHVFHMHFAISLFFPASSKHRYFRKDFLGREVNVCSERSCLMLSLAKQNWPCRVYIFPAPKFARALCGEGSRSTAAGGCSMGAAGMAALELLGKVTPGRPTAWKVHSLQIAPFPTLTLLLSSGVDNTSWHLGCDRKIDAFLYIRYYSWINTFGKKTPTLWE